ncbi:MAG: DUF1822 family protein [Cyanobacteria bacterium P01_G01_bin.38]
MVSTPLADWRDQQTEVIALDPENFDRAVELSAVAIGEARQWQVYLQALAYAGFADWLCDRMSRHPLTHPRYTLENPPYVNSLPAVCNLEVQDFKLCLLVIDHPLADSVSVPRAVLELPEFHAHFYVLVEVQEELAQVFIRGFVSHARLLTYHPTADIHPDWTYAFPIELWTLDPDRLLLQLELCDPLPLISLSPQSSPAPLLPLSPSDLPALLQNLDPNRPLWETCPWSQGRYLLAHPPLLQLIYQTQRSPLPALVLRLQETLALVSQPAVNVAQWFDNRLDDLAQSLAIYLPPQVTPAFRSIDRFERAIAALREQGMTLPETAAHAYQDIDWQGLPLRLCTLTWPLSEPSSENGAEHWSMLILVGMQTNAVLPDDLTLRISKPTELVCEATTELEDPFLYAQVDGQTSERFLVTLVLPEGPAWLSSPYQFQRNDDARSISFEVTN